MPITKPSAQSIRDLVAALHQVRLDRDLTYDQLADEAGVSRRNLFRLMNERSARAHDRTLHKLRRFVETHDSSQGASA